MPISATGNQPQYVLTLSDGVNTVGLLTPDRAGIRRLPRSPGVERKHTTQRDWTGGMGKDRVVEDTTRFYDSQSVWSMVSGQVCAGPMFRFSKMRTQNIGMVPGSAGVIYSNVGGLYARSFVADGAMTEQWVTVSIQWDDSTATTYPTIALYTDAAGAPGTVIWTNTLTAADFPEPGLVTFVSKNTSVNLVSGTTYWVVVTVANPFNVALDGSLTGKYKANGGGWSNTTGAPLFHVSHYQDADWDRGTFFDYRGGLYFVGRRIGGTTKLHLNGDRGKATGGGANTLTDTAKTWTTDEWVGAVVIMISGDASTYYSEILFNTANTLTTRDVINASAGLEYVIVGSDKWTEITGHGLASGIVSVAVMNNIAYFGRLEGVNIRRMRYDATTLLHEFADDGTNDGAWLLVGPHWSTGVTSLYRARHISGTVAVAPKQPWGTNLTFEADIDVGDRDSLIMSLAMYNNMVWAGNENGVFVLKNGKFNEVPIAMRAAKDRRNNWATAGWNTNFYFSLHDGLERLFGQIVDDIGPNRDEGMRNTKKGSFKKLLPVVQYMFGAYDAGAGDGRYSSVLATTQPGGDWHNIFTAIEKNQRISTIHYQAVPGRVNRLWMIHGRDIGYLEMPDDIHNPVNDTNVRYAWWGYLTTGWIDFDSPELEHYFDDLRVMTRNLGTDKTLRVFFKMNRDEPGDPASDWQGLAGFTQSPYERISIGGGGSTVWGQRIKFRIAFMSDSFATPVLNAFEVRGNQMNEVKYDFTIDVRIEDRLMLMSGDDSTQKASAVVNQLAAWQEKAAPLTLRFAGPGMSGIIDNVKCHIDPVSLAVTEWDNEETKLTGNILVKVI